MTPKTLLARDPSLLSESQFASLVVEVARLGGWKHFHVFNSRRSIFGFPDYVLVRGPQLIFAELKTEVGKVRPDQAEWLAALEVVGEAIVDGLGAHDIPAAAVPSVRTFVWRPSDWDDLVEILTGRRPREEQAA